jgi:DNA-binding NarL/FixJ family response regulator
VLDGGIYVSKTVSHNVLNKYAGGGLYASTDPIDRLSKRELQILLMIGQGMSTRETADSLRIKRKLNLSTGAQLVRYAVLGLFRRNELT